MFLRFSDGMYFVALLERIFSSLFFHLPALLLYYRVKVPPSLNYFALIYIDMTGDPLIGGLMGLIPNKDELVWFRAILLLDVLFLLPLSIYCAFMLWREPTSATPYLLVLSVSAATANLPCMVTNSSVLLASENASPEVKEHAKALMKGYLWFLIVPAYIAWDMTRRISQEWIVVRRPARYV